MTDPTGTPNVLVNRADILNTIDALADISDTESVDTLRTLRLMILKSAVTYGAAAECEVCERPMPAGELAIDGEDGWRLCADCVESHAADLAEAGREIEMEMGER